MPGCDKRTATFLPLSESDAFIAYVRKQRGREDARPLRAAVFFSYGRSLARSFLRVNTRLQLNDSLRSGDFARFPRTLNLEFALLRDERVCRSAANRPISIDERVLGYLGTVRVQCAIDEERSPKIPPVIFVSQGASDCSLENRENYEEPREHSGCTFSRTLCGRCIRRSRKHVGLFAFLSVTATK